MHLGQHHEITQETLVFNYLPAKLKKYKGDWLIEFYVENPISYEFERVRNRKVLDAVFGVPNLCQNNVQNNPKSKRK